MAATDNLKVLIVDDEIEACENLKNILLNYVDPDIQVLGMAYDTEEAEQQISLLKPDAVFWDIEMPAENAIQYLIRVFPFDFEVIFVTAFDQFAIKAFKLNAVDYILKPVDIEELSNAVTKLKEKLRKKDDASYKDIQLETLKQIATKETEHKIILKSLNHVDVVSFQDIFFIEGQGSYCKVCYLKDGEVNEVILSNTISDYEELLPINSYYRIHKSYLVNCMHIYRVLDDEIYEVQLKNKYKLPVSRRRYAGFIDFLKANNFS